MALTRRALALAPAIRARWPTWARSSCAPATSRRRARRSKRRSRSTRSTSSPSMLLRLLDTLDKFETIRDGDLIVKMSKDEAPVLKEYAIALAHQALDDDGGALRVHAEGPDPDRDVSQARRLRRQDARPARHDRRARRLLRPRRDARFAEGAAAGRIPLGGDAVARARPRHHAADVESARAAVADRRHFRVRRAARPSRMGAADGLHLRRAAQPRRNHQAEGPERGVSGSKIDIDRVLRSVARRRSSDHDVRPERPEQAAARLRPGTRHRDGAEGSAQHRLRPAAGGLRSVHRAGVRQPAEGAHRSEGRPAVAGAARRAANAGERESSKLSRAARLRRGAAEGREHGRGDAGRSSAPPAWRRRPPSATTARTRRWRKSRSRRKIARARLPS